MSRLAARRESSHKYAFPHGHADFLSSLKYLHDNPFSHRLWESAQKIEVLSPGSRAAEMT